MKQWQTSPFWLLQVVLDLAEAQLGEQRDKVYKQYEFPKLRFWVLVVFFAPSPNSWKVFVFAFMMLQY